MLPFFSVLWREGVFHVTDFANTRCIVHTMVTREYRSVEAFFDSEVCTVSNGALVAAAISSAIILMDCVFG